MKLYCDDVHIWQQAFSKDSLTAFANSFLAKELSPYVKPEE